MSCPMDDIVERRLRLGAVGSLGALTLLWLARMQPVLFPVGTVLLTMSMVPLATGFRARGGLLLGVLFGVLWVAAKMELMGATALTDFMNPANAIAVAAIVALGVASGLFFGPPQQAKAYGEASAEGVEARGLGLAGSGDAPHVLQDQVRQALRQFRDWMAEWDKHEERWTSFDNHIRELLHNLTGARRIRCYHLNVAGELSPMNGADPEQGNAASLDDGLVSHVMVTKRRYYARSPNRSELIQQLAANSQTPFAWIVPIRGHRRTCGLITVEEFEGTSVSEDRLGLTADLAEEFWQHLEKAEGLRLACTIDQPSGVLNRVEILGLLDQTVEQCYQNHEPVVMMALVVEGIRTMDDGGHWEARNSVVEAVGKTMRSRLRNDDVVGRFSDDRFIAVLRRLDVSLAHLIADKILKAAGAELGRRFPNRPVTLRAGLAGSGFDQVPPQELLLGAFDAINKARSKHVSLLFDAREAASVAGSV